MFSKQFKIVGYATICVLFIAFFADLYRDIGKIDFMHDTFGSWELIIRNILIFSFLSYGSWIFIKMMKEDEDEDPKTKGIIGTINKHMYAPYKYALKKSLPHVIIMITCCLGACYLYKSIGFGNVQLYLLFIPGIIIFCFAVINSAKREYCDMEAIEYESKGIFVFKNDNLFVVDTNIKYKDLIKATYHKSLDKIINKHKDKELIILKATQIIENVYGLKFR